MGVKLSKKAILSEEAILVNEYYEAKEAKREAKQKAIRETERQAELKAMEVEEKALIKKGKKEIDRIINSDENISRLRFSNSNEMEMMFYSNNVWKYLPESNPCRYDELAEYAARFGYKLYEDDRLKRCFLIKRTAVNSI